MCTRFQVPSTRSRGFAGQIQRSARWGLRPDLLRPSPNRATSQPPPNVAEERGGFRGGGHLSPPRTRVGPKAGFIPAVTRHATCQPPPNVAEKRGGFRGGGHLSPPRIATCQPPPNVAEERGGFRGGGHLSPRESICGWRCSAQPGARGREGSATRSGRR